MDIRSRPVQEWGRLLREGWPRPMAASLGWTPEEGSAVICVIIVMKMVISYTDNALLRDGNQLESVRAQDEAEEKNVLLRYAWHDTSEDVEKTWGIEPTAVLRLQQGVYADLMSPNGQWTRALSKGITFENLMESLPMWRHFWSRPEFRMRVGFEMEQKDGWVPLQRVLDPFDDTASVSGATLAKQSLVRWCSDETELAKRLSRAPIRVGEQGVRFRQVQGWSLGRQECIRVLYDPGTGKNPTGFQKLLEFTIAPKTLEIGEHGARWTDGAQIDYQLVAVVRLGPPVNIRIYDKSGKYSVPRALSSQAVLCLNNDWELGQPGSKYMLYYVLTSGIDPELGPAEERSPNMSKRGLARVVNTQQPNTAPHSISSLPPADAPKEPKAHRNRAVAKARASKPGLNPNLMPLGTPGAWRFDEESPAGPSGQHSESAGGSHAADAPVIEKPPKPQRFDPRRRSDQPGAREGFRTPVVDPNQAPRRWIGDPVEYDDMERPPRFSKPAPPSQAVPQPENPWARPENTGAQPRRSNDPRRRADEPGGPDSAQPHMWYKGTRPDQPFKKRRRLEEDDM